MSDIKAEPVAWRWKERVNDDFVIEWALTKYEPATTPRTVAIEPLYTADAIRAAVLAERERCADWLKWYDGQETRRSEAIRKGDHLLHAALKKEPT